MRSFSLSDGGPFYRFARRVGLVNARGDVRGTWFALALWLPLSVGEAVRALAGESLDPTLFDASVHIRLLVTLPMMFLAERLVERACASALRSVYAGQFCDAEQLDRIVLRAEKLRDAWLPEALLLVGVLAAGQLALWRIVESAGFLHAEAGVGAWSFPRLWYVVIALPLGQFVMFRWLWRWLIWTLALVKLSTLPLELLATHPDRAAGLSCLARPMSGFSAFAFALGSVLAGAWGTQILAHRTTLEAEVPMLVTFLLAMLALAAAPLLAFCGHLYRVRRSSLAQYGDFAGEYMRDFHARWLRRDRTESPIGSADIQSMNDIGGAYQVIVHTRLFVFGLRSVIAVWAGAAAPMAPLVASAVTAEELLKRIVNTIVHGLPL